MIMSQTITKISAALLKAQAKMDNATKASKNPYFKSSYADLNSIREVSLPALNEFGIVALQPTVVQDGKKYVQTTLLHESGEYIACLTEILCAKENDAQQQGSGITYARRYGLQSLLNIGAEDDDGNAANNKTQEAGKMKSMPEVRAEEDKKKGSLKVIENFLRNTTKDKTKEEKLALLKSLTGKDNWIDVEKLNDEGINKILGTIYDIEEATRR